MTRKRGFRYLLTTIAAALTVVTSATPAHAADVPAYGVITISNSGTGAVWEWTYVPALWSCSAEISGQSAAPTAITVTCKPAQGTFGGSGFACPAMILTAHTDGLAARAGGYAQCTSSLDTGIISGVNTAGPLVGDLGPASSIKCRAYGGGIPLIPPYTVTCNEPGLPGLG